ncbi:DUF5677 domain-containing protein [Vibrio vulnificus]
MNLRTIPIPEENDATRIVSILDDMIKLNEKILLNNKLDKEQLGMLKPIDMMTYLFFERMNNHNRSFIKLADENDNILISRSMFEGALFLAYATKNTDKKIAYRWKLSLYIQFMDEFEHPDFPPEFKVEIDAVKTDLDNFFKRNGKYHNKWLDKNIHDIAQDLDDSCKNMYKNYYKPMANFHHWDYESTINNSEFNNKVDEACISKLVNQLHAYLMVIFSNRLIGGLFLTLLVRNDMDSMDKMEKINERLDTISFIKTKHVTITSKHI